jgi:phosphonatase-like hydrolase
MFSLAKLKHCYKTEIMLMNNTIKMVVFDMAGTTVDEDNVVYKTVQKAINEAGFDLTLEQVLAEGAGKEKLQAIKDILTAYTTNTDPDLTHHIYQSFIAQLGDAYNALNISPQKNVTELFTALKTRGILVALDTGYDRHTAQTIIDKLGWQEGVDFDLLVTASEVEKNRPNPDMIVFAMKKFDLTGGQQVVKVGDSAIDIEEGQNAGCGLSIGITTGAHTRDQLKVTNPDYIIDDLIELIPIIDGHR